MNPLGIHLTLLIGPSIAVPAPPLLTQALQSVEVTHGSQERSGFQITFGLGRSGSIDLLDYALLSSPLLKAFNRVILVVTFNARPSVLMDGIITNFQFSPNNEPGKSTLTVTGEDVSVMMDMEEKSAQHPGQDETIIANKLIISYAEYGLIPIVIPPLVIDPAIPIERIPVQQSTDLQYLKRMAQRHGYVFYITPGPAPFSNTAYWGPPKRVGLPQSALTVNMGPSTNVDSISFQNNALAPAMVSGYVQDRMINKSIPVKTFVSMRPPLAAFPAWLVNQPNVRRIQMEVSGLSMMQAYARAQGETEAANEAVVTASGELDALRYGSLLQARGLVGLRGAGYLHDGLWYVKSVTHSIRREEYKQRFTLAREGLGSITPLVMP